MKRKANILVLLLAGAALVSGVVLVHFRNQIGHQRPCKWDAYVRPDLRFNYVPFSNVVKTVNEAVRLASKGAVSEAIALDTTPTRIVKFAPNSIIDHHMDEFIAAFRQHEQRLLNRGANGFESAPFSGFVSGRHSLGCTFMMCTPDRGLGYEERADAIHIWRKPEVLECRAYTITESLISYMEQLRTANRLYVGAKPIIAAFAEATGIKTWSVTIPDQTNEWTTSHSAWTGESRFDKVFRKMPDTEIILALATPEEHRAAKNKLQASGMSSEVTPHVMQR